MQTLNFKLLLLLCFLNINSAFSQTAANFGIGYGTGIHTKAGGLDFVIGRYNDTRSFLSKQMAVPKVFRGMSYSMDIFFPNGVMTMEWVARKSDVTAEVSSTQQIRNFRYRVNTFNFGYGKKLGHATSSPMGRYLGVDFSTISIKNYTRTYQKDADKPEYAKINWDLIVGFSPFLQFTGNRFTTKLYYQFMLTKANYWDVNLKLNPNTWFRDDYDSNKGKTSSLGIILRYNLFKNK